MGRFIDLTNQTFGRLTVLKRTGTDRSGNAVWKCVCSCGKIIKVSGYSIKSGHTQSCGCLHSEISSKIIKQQNTTHGKSNTRLYRIWRGMKTRCYNANEKCYQNYGARGIKMCSEWVNSFDAFYSWAIQNGYKENLTIDRKDNNGNYEPSNCRWTSREQQNNNRRDNIIVNIGGHKETLSRACRRLNINYHSVCTRIFRDGKTPEDAIFNY